MSESESGSAPGGAGPPSSDEAPPRRPFFDPSYLDPATLGTATAGWLVVLVALLILWFGWHSRDWRGIALVSLFVGLPVAFYFAILSFVLTVALGRHSGKNTIGLLLALAAGAVGWSIFLVTWAHPPRKTQVQIGCEHALKRIALAINAHDWENEGRLPPDLRGISDKYVDQEDLVCPAFELRLLIDKGVSPRELPYAGLSYCYVSGLNLDDSEHYILLFDEEWNHHGHGVNVLLLPGRVERLTGWRVEWRADIDALHDDLRKQAEELKAQGRETRIIRPSWSRWPEPAEGYCHPWFTMTLVHGTALGMAAAIAAAVELAYWRARGRRASPESIQSPPLRD